MKQLCKGIAILFCIFCATAMLPARAEVNDGSKARPLRVMLVPSDTGADSIADDFKPVFNAITQVYGLHFDIKVGTSFAAVVEGMCNEQVDVAWLGVVTLPIVVQRGCGEFLALDVQKGESVYYSGIFVARNSNIKSLRDLKGKSVAFGDVLSTSSFQYPAAMMLAAGVDPANDLGKIYMVGSHTNALAALREGRVDAACASFNVYEKSVQNGVIDPEKIRVLEKSEPIPLPPMGMHTKLKPEVKALLKKAFNNVHKAPGIKPEQIRGYGGKMVDRFDADYPYSKIETALKKLSAVTDGVTASIIKKSGER
jgi:phosphonate transport system substrate-binding protein